MTQSGIDAVTKPFYRHKLDTFNARVGVDGAVIYRFNMVLKDGSSDGDFAVDLVEVPANSTYNNMFEPYKHKTYIAVLGLMAEVYFDEEHIINEYIDELQQRLLQTHYVKNNEVRVYSCLASTLIYHPDFNCYHKAF